MQLYSKRRSLLQAPEETEGTLLLRLDADYFRTALHVLSASRRLHVILTSRKL